MKEPDSSILKPPTVTELLQKRETGCVKNVHRYNLLFFRKLVAKDEFGFKLTYKLEQQRKIHREDDKVFVKNGRHVHSLRADRIKESTKLYSIEQYAKKMQLTPDRILSLKEPIFSSTVLPRSAYRPMLLILNDKNTLLHIDFETGELIDSIYLGSLERCKFRYIGWESYMKTVLVQSIDSLTKSNGKVICYNIILSIRPLKFIACIELETRIFGKQSSPKISERMLILSSSHQSNKLVNIYSLMDILHPDNFKWHTDIGKICVNASKCDECTRGDCRIVGKDTHGFPVNLSLKNKPRLLFSILTSCEESIDFGGYPYQTIYSPPDQKNAFNVESIDGRVPVVDGSITFDDFMEEHNTVFYIDELLDNRIIAIEAHKLAFYKIINNVLVKSGELSPTPLAYLKKLHEKSTESGKAKVTDDLDKSIFTYAYDDETAIWFVLGVDLSTKTHNLVMCLFDNYDGRLLKKINLKKKIKADEFADYDIYFDLDLLYICQNNTNHSKAICYRLVRDEF